VKSKSLLGFATAAAGAIAGGAAAMAGKTAGAAASVAGRIASVADSVAKGLQGYAGIRRGSFLSGLANIGGALAGGLGSFARGAEKGLGGFAAKLGGIANDLLKAGMVVDAARSYRGAAKGVSEAKRALAAAQASGDAAAIAAAQSRLTEAERAKKAALFSGLGTAAMLAADRAGQRRTPEAGEGLNRPPAASPLEAGLRAASRGLSAASSLTTRDWEGAAVAGLGAAAAFRSAFSSPQRTYTDPMERQAAERVGKLLGGTARRSGNPESIRLAEAQLREARQSDRRRPHGEHRGGGSHAGD
jgi:hypothetical protein